MEICIVSLWLLSSRNFEAFPFTLFPRKRYEGSAHRCNQLQKHGKDGKGVVCSRNSGTGDDKEGTNDDGAPFRRRTYDIGFYARNNARAPAVRGVAGNARLLPVLSGGSLFFSISRTEDLQPTFAGGFIADAPKETHGGREITWPSSGEELSRTVCFAVDLNAFLQEIP